MKKNINITNKSGAVSLFVVIFFSLLVSVLIFGFARTAIKQQQASTSSNLSQSAYDASQVGIEDAKRLLLKYKNICTTAGTSCNAIIANLDSTTCNGSVSTLYGDGSSNSNEVLIKQDQNSNYNQAYTCVIIDRKPVDFIGTLSADETKIVPLVGTGDFNKIQIEWYSKSNIETSQSQAQFADYGGVLNLPVTDSYSTSMPPIISAKFINIPTVKFYINGVQDISSNKDFYSRLFMKPNQITLGGDVDSRTTTLSHILDTPQVQKNLNEVNCESTFKYTYACKVQITIPTTSSALLELKAFYNSADYRVTLFKNNDAVNFNESQIKVDSTGRAGDVFRRVETRIEKSFEEVYPSSAIELTNSFCKDFNITETTGSPFSGVCLP